MVYKGKRLEDGEYFDDVVDHGSAGILAGAGLADYDSLKESMEQDGLKVELNCRLCNAKRGIILEWPELYWIASNAPGLPVLLPRGWALSPNNGTMFLQAQCSKCGQPGLAVHVTPEEARRNVKNAVDSGLVSPAIIEQLKRAVLAARSQHR
jgi:hypothetical protein